MIFNLNIFTRYANRLRQLLAFKRMYISSLSFYSKNVQKSGRRFLKNIKTYTVRKINDYDKN